MKVGGLRVSSVRTGVYVKVGVHVSVWVHVNTGG